MAPITIGAALRVADLDTYAPWLRERQRDLELQDFTDAATLSGDWSGVVDEARRRLDGFTGRLGIHGPFWGITIHSKDPDIRAVVARRMDQGLDVCAALGATQMVIHSPYSTWDHNNLDGNAGAREAVIENTHATLGAAVARAADMGVTLVVENIEDVDPSDRRHLVESFGSDAIRLSIDTGHAQYAHRATGAPPVDYFVTDAGRLLHHMHLQDADGYADRHWAIGEGNVPWRAVFRAIAALEHRPHLVLELKDKGGIPASIAYLTSLGLAE